MRMLTGCLEPLGRGSRIEAAAGYLARQRERVDVQPDRRLGRYAFSPSAGHAVTIGLPSGTSARCVRLDFTASTGWDSARLSGFLACAP